VPVPPHDAGVTVDVALYHSVSECGRAAQGPRRGGDRGSTGGRDGSAGGGEADGGTAQLGPARDKIVSLRSDQAAPEVSQTGGGSR